MQLSFVLLQVATLLAQLSACRATDVETVTPPRLTSLAVTVPNQPIGVCDCAKLTVTGTLSDGTQHDMTDAGDVSIQSSDDSKVRIFRGGGLWLACSDSQPGAVTVTARHAGDNITASGSVANARECH